MDAFSRLAENLHLYETRYHCIQGYGQWAYHFNKPDTLIFYLVLEGGFYLIADGDKRIAHKGDMIMLAHTTYHTCQALKIDLNHHPDDNNGSFCDNVVIDKTMYDEVEHEVALQTLIDKDTNSRVILNEGNGHLNAKLVLIECQYDNELTRPILSTLPVMLPECVQDKLNGSEVLDIGIDFLSIESSNERMGKDTMVNRLAGILMVECLRTYIESLPEASDSWLLAIKDPYLSKALARMHESPDEHWTINSLAKVAGMSRSSFAERFKQVVGVPPLTYLIKYRLRSAARYLRLQQHSISRISELVGYASDSTFSQAFKRVYGVSPRQYRQQNHEVTLNKIANEHVLPKTDSLSKPPIK